MTKKPRKKTHMSKQEKIEWDDLCDYVRYKVMGYDQDVGLSRNMVLRLKGMSTGKFVANNSQKDTAHYSYLVILNTFKYSMPEIQRAINRVSFANEGHKFNYIMRIVDGNLNTVYLRMKRAEKAKEEVVKETTIVDEHKAVKYKPTKKTVKKDKFADLW